MADMSQWFVYIARTKFNTYYTGITTHPSRRITQHNRGTGSKLARDQQGFELVYVSLPLLNQSEARKREIQIKGWTRSKKEKLISGEWK